MGLILELFQKDSYNKRYGNFSPDFENTQVDSQSQKTYDEVTKSLVKSKQLIEEVTTYRSNQNEIRNAMQNPASESQRNLFEKLGENVEKLKLSYNFSNNDVVTMFQNLRNELARIEEEKLEDEEKLRRQGVWSKLLADLISFVLQWDQCKMRTPALLNDYSFYKREFVKLRYSLPQEQQDEFLQMSGKMSFWLAQSMPMSKTLGQALKDDRSRELLRDISAFCCSLVKNEKFAGANARENEILCLRCAVGCIILYDEASEGMGAFASNTFETKSICQTLDMFSNRTDNWHEICEELKSVIRYGSSSYQQYGSKAERRYIGA
jgi:hypothetical protein